MTTPTTGFQGLFEKRNVIQNPPIYRVPRYNMPFCVTPISYFTIEHVSFPPIYRAFLLSPEKHGKSGDYCTYIPRQKQIIYRIPTLANVVYGDPLRFIF